MSPLFAKRFTRTPRKPARCRRSSSDSATSVATTATPRQAPCISTRVSSWRSLSMPYTLGVTSTARAIPSVASNCRYCARVTSGGVNSRLGENGYRATGPKMCA